MCHNQSSFGIIELEKGNLSCGFSEGISSWESFLPL